MCSSWTTSSIGPFDGRDRGRPVRRPRLQRWKPYDVRGPRGRGTAARVVRQGDGSPATDRRGLSVPRSGRAEAGR
ncbi:hypothetical protein Cus16_2512 [Curtobacterium sp. ER1/6]|nr:hypothetical protein Cus16_2512 [Curtobacterium sp. ER1/6]